MIQYQYHMKKIIAFLILLAVVVYLASQMYINQTAQKAQAVSSNTIIGGALDTRNWPQKDTVTFTLQTSQPMDTPVVLQGQLIPASSVVNGVTVSVAAEALTVGSAQTKYTLTVPSTILVGTYTFKVDGGGMSWTFGQTVEITPAKEATVLPYLTVTANEARITGFNITLDKPTEKMPGAYKLAWTGGGRGIALSELKGPGAYVIKQLKYESLFPVENAGYKDIPAFYLIPSDGVGEIGSGNVYLINPSTKALDIKAVFAPKGENGSISPQYAKTVEVNVPPSAPKIIQMNPRMPKAGQEVTVYMSSPAPIAQFAGSLREAPNTELKFLKNSPKESDIVVSPVKFTMENTMTFTVPATVKPGKYKMSLKSPLGVSVFQVQIAK